MLSILLLKLMQLKNNIVIVLLMIALSLGFIFVLAGPGNQGGNYKILVATQETTPSYLKFMEELRKTKSYRFEEVEYELAKTEVEEGKVLAGIYYVDDEIRMMKTREDVNIMILKNLALNTLFNIRSATRISEDLVDYLDELDPIDRKEAEGFLYEDLIDSIENRKSMIVTRGFDSGDARYEFDGFKHITIGMILFMSMFTIVFGIGSILEDKQYKTWNKMIISPLSKQGILGGNLISAFLVGASQIFLLMFITKNFMGMDWGPGDRFGYVVLIGLLFVMATTALGLLLASLVKTNEQLSTMTPILLTSTSMLGGAMWPLEIVESKAIRFLANLTPQKWAIEGIETIVMYNGSPMDILPGLGVLLLMTIVFFTIGVKRVSA